MVIGGNQGRLVLEQVFHIFVHLEGHGDDLVGQGLAELVVDLSW
jgi:hypothetical protein